MEEILTNLPLKGKTRGENTYHTWKQYAYDINLLLKKRVCVTDGAPVMVGSRNG
jgi:hypothetical protein